MFTLEKFLKQDFDLYAKLVFNTEAMTMNMGRVFTQQEAEFFFHTILQMNAADRMLGYYKVFLSDGSFIGMLGISENEDGDLELEYMLLPEHWGIGYATRIVKHQVQSMAKIYPGRRLRAITDPQNIRSIRVLEKNRFVKYKDYINSDSDNAVMYAIEEL